jgi:DegV family protein with EDD domain
MKKYAVFTDSACDIPPAMEKEYGVQILPFNIHIDGKDYLERIDFSFEEYYDMLLKCQSLPKTSQITMMRFEELFEQQAALGVQELLYVSINSTGSNTYNAALMAAQNFADEHPDSTMRIWVVDSHTYSMAYGMPVCEAAAKLKNGAEMADVVAWLKSEFARQEIVLAAFTLQFIKKSGRVSAAAAFAGELLGLRPIIDLTNGESTTIGKVRGDPAVMPALVKRLKEKYVPENNGYYLIAGTDMENCKMLAKLCKKELGTAPRGLYLLGAAVSTNTGPNALAIIYSGAPRT